MSPPSCLITGATGFVGSHLAEAAIARGWSVRALVRPGRETPQLDQLGVTVVRGDLGGQESLAPALEGITVVVHCAAKVGDWGPVEEYRSVNVEGLRRLLDACQDKPVERFVHISSLGVYEARDHHATDENEPLPAQHVDGYTQTKVEGENLARTYHSEKGIPVVVLRPGFIYGPRDRTVLPQLIQKLRGREVRYLGSGNQAMNSIYVGNLVEAIFRAVEVPEAVGQVYNLTDGEQVSKRRFLTTICDGLGIPHPRPVGVPMWLARFLAWWMEGRARKRGAATPPRLTQARLKFLGLNLDFSIEKARQELGYQPRWSFDEGMRETLAWYRDEPGAPGASDAAEHSGGSAREETPQGQMG